MISPENPICYLCGKDNPDNRDHFPPKLFLNPGNFEGKQRVLLPTHTKCNESYSKDEEYVRDYIALISKNNDYAKHIYQCTLRSLSRKEARGKYENIVQNINLVEERTVNGLYTGRKVLQFNIDIPRFVRVAMKMFRGLYFKDTNILVDFSKLKCFVMTTDEYEKEEINFTPYSNHYWRHMFRVETFNEMIDENIKLKKRYLLDESKGKKLLRGFAGIGIHEFFFGSWFEIEGIPGNFIKPDGLQIIY